MLRAGGSAAVRAGEVVDWERPERAVEDTTEVHRKVKRLHSVHFEEKVCENIEVGCDGDRGDGGRDCGVGGDVFDVETLDESGGVMDARRLSPDHCPASSSTSRGTRLPTQSANLHQSYPTVHTPTTFGIPPPTHSSPSATDRMKTKQ